MGLQLEMGREDNYQVLVWKWGLARPGRDVDSHLSPGSVGSSGRTGLHQVCPKAWGGGALGAVALSVAAARTWVNVFIKLAIFFFS